MKSDTHTQRERERGTTTKDNFMSAIANEGEEREEYKEGARRLKRRRICKRKIHC